MLKHLISNVLMVFGGAVASNGVIARDVQALKDQAVQFIWLVSALIQCSW